MEKLSSLSMFEVAEHGMNFLAMRVVRNVCASVELVDGLFVPAVADNEYGSDVWRGRGTITAEAAAAQALAMARSHLLTMAHAFEPVAGCVDEMLEIDDGYSARNVIANVITSVRNV